MTRAVVWMAMAWALAAQTAPKTVLGTVTTFKVDSLEFGVKPDKGEALLVKVGPDTDVVAVSPGERDLGNAKQAKLTDIALGDRIMVSYVEGLTEARRIVLISADDIARRNEAERLDWQQRGISGIVSAKNAEEISIEMRSPGKVKTATIVVTRKTRIRRYAPDSVKFANALPGTLDEIASGDQLQARGKKSEDGSKVVAEEIVFGTFLTKVGTVTAVNAEKREIRIDDLVTKKPLSIRVTEASQMKALPDMRAMFISMMKAGQHQDASGSSTPAPPKPAPSREEAFDIKKVLEQLPAATIGDVKVGSAIIVTSTRGANSDELTAIMLLANADGLIQMAQTQAGAGANPMDAISSMHGGMLSGPSGLTLPAILQ